MKWRSIEADGFPPTTLDESGSRCTSIYLCFVPMGPSGELFFFTAWHGKWLFISHHHDPILAEEMFGGKVTHYVHKDEVKPRLPKKRRTRTSTENAP